MNNDKAGRAALAKRLLFVFCSRPLFRTCEIACNHAARILFGKFDPANGHVRNALDELNSARIQCQKTLSEIGFSHAHVCAECRGKCCGGDRERDAFIDRVLQDPDTTYLGARRREGQMAAHKLLANESGGGVAVQQMPRVEGFCPELTALGCRVPYELRPIQCTAYFCTPTVDELSNEECGRGIEALLGLMKVQLGVVALAAKLKGRSVKRP